ncbi:hypothetical protein CALK_2218 [Chitinivibrio alkaliphilus ACht1]|uniref:SH3b domain-containing protein n=2 Tax=Chitinivibrio TaxID=1505231 RepID=U7D746_9BACT|nr:hypothetical protein CALK_2218 [Chitinivibrio alkaliphilus ACht1]
MHKQTVALILFILSVTVSADFIQVQSGSRGVALGVVDLSTGYEFELQGHDSGVVLSLTSTFDTSVVGMARSFPEELPLDSMGYDIQPDRMRLFLYSSALSPDAFDIRERDSQIVLRIDTQASPEFTTLLPNAESREYSIDSITVISRDKLEILRLHGAGLEAPRIRREVGIVTLSIPGIVQGDAIDFSDVSLLGVDSVVLSNGGTVAVHHIERNYSLLTSGIDGDDYILYFHNANEQDTPFVGYFSETSRKTAPLKSDISSSGSTDKYGSAEDSESETMYIVGSTVNFREDPEVRSDNIVGILDFGTAVAATDQRDDWVKITHRDNSGWAHGDFLKTEQELSSDEKREILNSQTFRVDRTAASDEVQVLYMVRDNVNFRTSPSTQESENIIGQYPLGTRVVFLDASNGWVQGRLEDGRVGWVYESLVQDSTRISSDTWDAIHNHQRVHAVHEAQEEEDTAKVSTDTELTQTDEEATEDIRDEEDDFGSRKRYTYTRYGRDPFIPLPEKRKQDSLALPRVDNMTLVGVIYGGDRNTNFALFEEKIGSDVTTFSLKHNDPIENGRVLRVKEKSVVFLMEDAGFSYVVEKELRK